MPEQVFAAKVKFPSGKTRDIQIKLVNFRGDPDNPEDMERARYWCNRLTPVNATVLPEGFKLIHDDARDDLQTQGVEDLVRRPMEMQTETAKSVPLKKRPTEAPADESPTVSRAVSPESPEARDASLGEGRPPRPR